MIGTRLGVEKRAVLFDWIFNLTYGLSTFRQVAYGLFNRGGNFGVEVIIKIFFGYADHEVLNATFDVLLIILPIPCYGIEDDCRVFHGARDWGNVIERRRKWNDAVG